MIAVGFFKRAFYTREDPPGHDGGVDRMSTIDVGTVSTHQSTADVNGQSLYTGFERRTRKRRAAHAHTREDAGMDQVGTAERAAQTPSIDAGERLV